MIWINFIFRKKKLLLVIKHNLFYNKKKKNSSLKCNRESSYGTINDKTTFANNTPPETSKLWSNQRNVFSVSFSLTFSVFFYANLIRLIWYGAFGYRNQCNLLFIYLNI